MHVSPEERLAAALADEGVLLALAESCTGGLISHRITEVPGSSAYFERGVVVYSNRAKTELLGVPESLIEQRGAVSEACALAMLQGLFDRTPAGLAAAVTGIAGPTGGNPDKPVGTVWVAWGTREERRAEHFRFSGGRSDVKRVSADAVLLRLAELAEARRGRP
jgi:PncC family amidohydrolase